MKRRRYLINDSTHPIFVTTTIVGWIPVFSERYIATEALCLFENLRTELKMIVYGYVLMPSHLHAIVEFSRRGGISVFMRKWKSKTANDVRNFCETEHPEWIERFRRSAERYNLTQFQTFQVWQPRFDEKAIRDDSEFIAKLNYMHGNPLKHNLVDDCQDYPYSSFADYNGGKNDFVSVKCGHNKL